MRNEGDKDPEMLRSRAACPGPRARNRARTRSPDSQPDPSSSHSPSHPEVSTNHLEMVIVSGFLDNEKGEEAKSQRDSGGKAAFSQQVILSHLAMFTSSLDITRDLTCRI